MPDPFRRSAISSGQGGGGAPALTTVPSTSNSPVDFTAVRRDVDDVMAGRITLAMLDAIILGLIVFYIATKNVQGGA